MLVGMLLTRTLGQLGKVGSKAVSCGKLVKLFWGEILQHTGLFGLRMSVRLINYTGKTVKDLEEKEDEVIQASLGKKVKKD